MLIPLVSREATTMRVVLFVTVSLSLFIGVQVLTCIPGYCEKNPCVSPDSCPEGQGLYSHACSCCKYCIPLIPQGGRCQIKYGVPLNSRCEDGTHCANGICRKSD